LEAEWPEDRGAFAANLTRSGCRHRLIDRGWIRV
jgi:hypothetical protein